MGEARAAGDAVGWQGARMTMRGVVVLGVALVALVGCQGELGGVTPAVSGSSAVTPSSSVASSSPSASVSQSKQELVAEAEGRFREYFALQVKVEAAGGTTTLDPMIDSYVAEPYRGALLESLTAMKSAGVRVENSSRVDVTSVTPFDEGRVEGAVVALRVCQDASKATVVTPSGQQPGPFILTNFWFKRDAFGELRIFRSDELPDKTC